MSYTSDVYYVGSTQKPCADIGQLTPEPLTAPAGLVYSVYNYTTLSVPPVLVVPGLFPDYKIGSADL